MSNVNISGLTKRKRYNRKVFTGPVTTTWIPPDGVNEVEVHVWGGGGNGGTAASLASGVASGGGGGGYVSHLYKNLSPLTPLTIVVGDSAGTSSVSCPSHPTNSQPISATGGSPGVVSSVLTGGGGAGGAGSFASVPVPLRVAGFTTSYSGGTGGGINIDTVGSKYNSAGGGAAGSHLGPGGNGGYAPTQNVSGAYIGGGNGGGIGGQNARTWPVTNLPDAVSVSTGGIPADSYNAGQAGFPLHAPFASFGTRVSSDVSYAQDTSFTSIPNYPVPQSVFKTFSNWFYLDEITSASGIYLSGSSDVVYAPSPSPGTDLTATLGAGKGNVGAPFGGGGVAPFLGGGAGTGAYGPPSGGVYITSGSYTEASFGGGGGGSVVNPAPIGPGGAPGPSLGGKGVVIIYW